MAHITQAQYDLIRAREADIDLAYEAGRLDLLALNFFAEFKEIRELIRAAGVTEARENIRKQREDNL